MLPSVSKRSPTLFWKLSWLAFVVTGWAFSTVPASAANQNPIVVAEFQGAKKSGVRLRVVELLRRAGYVIASESESPDIDPSASSAKFTELAESGGFAAFVMAHTDMSAKGWKTSFTIREGRSGAVIGNASLGAGWYPGLLQTLDRRLLERISGPLDRAQAPEGKGASTPSPAPVQEDVEGDSQRESNEQAASEEAEPEKEERLKAAEAVEGEPEEPRADRAQEARLEDDLHRHSRTRRNRRTSLEVEIGPLVVQRQWALSDPVAGRNRGPILNTQDAPLFGAAASFVVYPIGLFSSSFLQHLAVEGAVQRSLVGKSEFPGAAEARATTHQLLIGSLRVRVPAGTTRFGIFGGVGVHTLAIAGEKRIAAIPDASYRFLRAGADVSFALSRHLFAGGGLAYRAVLGFGDRQGEIANDAWFADATGAGLDANVHLALSLSRAWQLRLGGAATRYALDFNPSLAAIDRAAAAGDVAPPIVGGATDSYYTASLGLAVLVH